MTDYLFVFCEKSCYSYNLDFHEEFIIDNSLFQLPKAGWKNSRKDTE